MIKLNGSRLVDILPENMAKKKEVRAFSHAVGKQVERLCAYADGARVYACLSSMPENVLDYMATELRTPAYNQTFTKEVKKKMVADTMTFYLQMGTPAACNKIIEIIFGTGYIEEWFSYKGQPHHFRAYVGQDGGQIKPGDLEEFRRVLGSVKRLSSWMDDIITIATLQPDIVTITGCIGKGYAQTSLPEVVDYNMDNNTLYALGAFGTITSTSLRKTN